jgi:type I restriction enzyme S subunit
MGVNYHKSKLSIQNSDYFLRLDYKYHSVIDISGWDIFQTNCEKLIPLREILTPCYSIFEYDDEFEYNGILTGREYLSEFGDIISVQTVTKDEHPNRLRYKADENCILISSLKGARIPALSFDFDISNYVFSNGFYIFKVNSEWSKKFVLYLLRTEKIKSLLDNNIFRGIGISAYKEEDLLKILIPKILIENQKKSVEKIEPIEIDIANLKNSKLKPIDIINKVFGDEFNFDWNEFDRLKSQKIFNATLADFSNNIDCRFGYKFHNKAGQFIYNFLCSKSNKRIKNFISEPIVLGKSVSPSDYDEDGEFYYIAMSNIKTWLLIPRIAKKYQKTIHLPI